MAAGYRRGTKAADGPQTLDVVGGVRKDEPGPLTGVDGAYTEVQIDAAGNLRVIQPETADDVNRAILEQLVLLNHHLALFLAAAAN